MCVKFVCVISFTIRSMISGSYQVSDSDGDLQKELAKNDTRIISIESDDDDQVPGSERKIEDIQGCEIERSGYLFY
ncbi:hypothetical protein AQUCO_05000013v1 [Aquilegia coerulea]|uniref:Uncharacterized protein n=1 Tax=Aquilegia coerulea TaxID=218851 RepID=A0A2G5CJ63_AQUCA|nr:hypothetical protein AQUCO_05000013v1 [Aquilegia coerulea]